MKKVQLNIIVGICGSASALDAYKVLLDAVEDDTGMVFVIFLK